MSTSVSSNGVILKHRARKRFGQNFLQDSGVIDSIVNAINPQREQHIIEIGPGKGALTFPILECVKNMQAIEIDRDLITFLKRASNEYGKLSLIEGDALCIDFASLGRNLRLIGNLPYNISTPLLLHLLDFIDSIKDMHFMLQKEVVLRLCANPSSKAYGRLSVIVQYFCEVDYLFTVPPEAFFPKPKVDSAIVRLQPRDNKEPLLDLALFEQVVAKAFSKRRKTLLNNMKELLDRDDFNAIQIDCSARAECLEITDFVNMTNYLKEKIR